MHLESCVGPRAELHFTVLVIEGEPCDVNLRKPFVKVSDLNKERGMND